MRRKMLVIDTETGGIDSEKHSLLTLAALVMDDGTVIDSLSLMINEPEITAEAEALKVNGLNLDTIRAEGDDPLQAVNRLEAMLDKHDMRKFVTIVAHNASFDVGFMKRLYRLAGKDFGKRFSYRPLCTVTAAMLLEQAGRLKLPGGSASLDNVTKVLGITVRADGAAHDAGEDARACAAVYKRLIDMLRN